MNKEPTKNCVTYLVRTSSKDLQDLNESLELLSKNLLKTDTDVLLFVEESFTNEWKQKVNKQKFCRFKWIEIKFEIPEFLSEEIKNSIPEHYPHPTHGNGPIAWGHPGFTIGYRHMCRWFSGEMYKHPAFDPYKFYLRLDCDSFIRTKLSYDIFNWMELEDNDYGFIEQAVQFDNPRVVEGLWDKAKEILKKELVEKIPSGKMFYTNFEIGKIERFRQNDYMNFFDLLDNSGGFYTKRWGDAPIKFLGVTCLFDLAKVSPVFGFTYQHGAVYSV